MTLYINDTLHKCRIAQCECRYAERCFVECNNHLNVILSVVILNVVMPSVVAPTFESLE